MRRIKQLPDAVHSSMRSSVVLFDLSRVVEELIYNSIDAAATKVHVAVSVQTCYVKVDDDGSGITRDGLVLLGEKYATSKLKKVADMDAASETFGFRGEALGSLSDISLVEIITKARGMPNGYRKIIKECKSLYLGIDNKQGFGTTVVVRDLFYNQPVRRTYMQSSFKKVLHSVKKCVFRISLVNPHIAFKVNDVESGDELICTFPSLSPLPLVASGFGTDISTSLCEINFSEGGLNLSGYLSDPVDASFLKNLQYLYINSRFVCKGPIHKLLNNLAASSFCLDTEGALGSQNGKRSRTQAHPAFILNLRCPRLIYDLTFEPSKTSVEFKDWVPVLTFIEQAFRHFWRQSLSGGEFSSHEDEISGKNEMWKEDDIALLSFKDESVKSIYPKEKCLMKHSHTSLHLSTFPTSADIHSKESDLFSHHKYDSKSSRKTSRSSREVGRDQTKSVNIHQNDNTYYDNLPSLYTFIAESMPIVSPEHRSLVRAPDDDSFALQENFFSYDMTVREDIELDEDNDILGSRWGKHFLEVDGNLTEGSARNQLNFNRFEYRKEAPSLSGFQKGLKGPFLRSCSLLGNVTPDKRGFGIDQNLAIEINTPMAKRKRLPPSDMINIVTANESNSSVDIFLDASLEGRLVPSSPSSNIFRKCQKMIDSVPMNFVKPCQKVKFSDGRDVLIGSLPQVEKIGSSHLSTNTGSCPVPSFSWFGASDGQLEHFTDEYAEKRNIQSCRTATFCNSEDIRGKDLLLSHDTMQNGLINDDFLASGCSDTELEYACLVAPRRNPTRTNSHRFESSDFTSLEHETSSSLADGTKWFSSRSPNMASKLKFAKSSVHIPSPVRHNNDWYPMDELSSRDHRRYAVSTSRSRRCHSAPPFHKRRNKISTLYSCLTDTWTESAAQAVNASPSLPEATVGDDPLFQVRGSLENFPCRRRQMKMVRNNEDFDKSQMFLMCNSNDTDFVEDFSSMDDTKFSETKWRNGNPHTAQKNGGDQSPNLSEKNDVLDISSGLLHFAGGSIIPDSISKECLANAKVLLQLDRKFIPIVGSSTLAVIDQHAADERIRLEELRQKVLYGEGKTVAYLDSEQDLVLPEVGYQLLKNYAEQVHNWGWICSVDARGPGSFTKKLKLLHRRPSSITLIAVPCILGVNLSDKDLLEFLEQLSETDGSATIPPSVLRVLNFKACRGAIMFGDTLLPSECSLIVGELKHTTLCFQCAHGRPTIAPLINLDALHKQIVNLGSWNEGPHEVQWHGLRSHSPSLERAMQRLAAATG